MHGIACTQDYVLDRWLFSTFAYQRNIVPWAFLAEILARLPLFPHLTFFLHIDPIKAEERQSLREFREKYEHPQIQKEVIRNYHELWSYLASRQFATWDSYHKLIILDATRSIEDLHTEILSAYLAHRDLLGINT